MKQHLTKLMMVLGVFAVSIFTAKAQTTYTVGSSTGADYASVQAAATALRTMTISGPIVIEIEDGTYTGEVDLTTAISTTSSNTVTFRSQSLDSTKVIITATSGNAIDLDADYITIEHVTVRFTGRGDGIELNGDNNTIKNCRLEGSTTYAFGNYCINATGDNNIIEHNNFRGGGYYAVNESRCEGNEYNHNEFKLFGRSAIYMRESEGYVIDGNLMDSTNTSFSYAIYAYRAGDGYINANKIYNTSYGIYSFDEHYNGGDSTVITNNVIRQQSSFALYAFGSDKLRIYHNVFEGRSYGAYFYGYQYSWGGYEMTDNKVMNNIFITDGGTYPLYFRFFTNLSGTYEDTLRVLDHNDYFTTNASVTTPNIYYNTAMAYNAIPNTYKSQGHNAVSVDPKFSDAKAYETFVVGLNNVGFDVGVDKDINGNTRPNTDDTQVDIGANDFYLPPFDLDVVDLVSPMQVSLSGNTITANFKSSGSDTIKNFDAFVEYSVDSGATWVRDTLEITALAPGEIDQFTFTQTWTPTRSGNFTISVRIATSVANDPDAVDRIDVDLCTPLAAGTYIVGASSNADYASMRNVAADLNRCGVGGNVVFELENGTYTGLVEFGEVLGASASSTITFRGSSRDSVSLENGGTVLILDGTDHMHFENITIENTTFANVTTYVVNDANHNSFTDCTLKMPISSSFNSSAFVLVMTTEVGQNFSYGDVSSYNRFENNLIEGGYYSMRINGNNNLAVQAAKGNAFVNNTIRGFRLGPYIYFQDSMDFVYNKVDGGTSTSLYFYYGWNCEVSQNNFSGVYKYLYYMDTYIGVAQKTRGSRFANNWSFSSGTSTWQRGWYIYYCKDMEIVNNNFVGNTSSLLYMFGNSGPHFYNNHIHYSGTGNAIESGWNGGGTFATFDYNNYYKTGTGNIARWNNVTYSSVTSFVGAIDPIHNQNNWNLDPEFVDASNDLHATAASPSLFGKQNGLEVDYDGDQRCLIAPSVGADEIPTVQLPPRANFVADDTLWLGSPASLLNANKPSQTVIAQWYLNGVFVSDSIHLNYIPSNTGLDTVTLIMQNCSGTDSITRYVFVSPIIRAPEVDFAATTTDVYTGEEIGLIDLTENGATQWEWDITNSAGGKAIYDPFLLIFSRTHWFVGDDSTTANATIWFDYPGTYTVKYKVANSFGADSTTKTAFIKVREQVQMCDIPFSTSGEVGTLFDDGGADGGYSPNLSGFNRCTYTIESCRGELLLNIAEFDLGADDYLKIYDGNNAGGTPLWDVARFPDGMTGMRNNPSVIRRLVAQTGSAFFEFTSDADATTLGDGFAIDWEYSTPATWPTSPVASIVAPDTACVGFPTVFESMSTGSISDQEWDLNADGTVDAFGDEFSYTFTTAGTYTIQLNANSLCAPKDSAVKTIVIEGAKRAPAPDFTASATKVNTGDTVMLESSADYCSDATKWVITPANYIILNAGTDEDEDMDIIFTRGGFYDVSITKSNPQGDSTITKTSHIQVLDYCTPNVILSDGDIGISRVAFNTIDNSSATNSSYNDYLDMATTVERGYTYDLTVERATNNKELNRKAWIDWNVDGDFDDTLEMVAYAAADTTKSATFSVTVPAGATGGESRMRVGVSWKDNDNTACGPNKFGEFEDYTINIMEEDMTAPELTLQGSATETIEVHTSWTESGYTAIDLVDGDITSEVTINSSLDTAMVGVYTVDYVVSDANGNTATASRTIEVIDSTDPIIALEGDATVTMQIFTSYTEAGTTASDNYDNALNVVTTSNLDTAMLGTYTINYCVTDAEGNGPVCVTRTVIVEDSIAPIITLNGNESEEVEVFSFYNDAGYTVVENDGFTVERTGNWDGTADSLGTFTVTYTVTDNAGNTATVTRTIEVVDTQAPVISLNGSALENLMRWDEHSDEGVTVEDNYDAAVDVSVAVVNTVNTQSEGVYTIEYTATDLSGNTSATVTRVVIVTQDMTSSIEDLDNNGFAIYPNPSSGVFNVATSLDNGETAQLRILDLTGKEIYNAGNYVVSNSKFEVDMSHLATGTYYIEIANHDAKTIEKVVLTK